MKKLWSFIFLLFCISLPFLSTNQNSTFLKDNNFDIECYYNFYNSNFPDSKIVKNGLGCIVKTYSVDYFLNLDKYNFGLSGITFSINAENFSLKQIKKELKLREHSLSSDENVYGLSKYFSHSINLENKKVNVQILKRNGKIYIGSPILLGSY